MFTDPEVVDLISATGFINMLNSFNNPLEVWCHGEFDGMTINRSGM